MIEALFALAVLLLLIFLRLPIAFALAIVGVTGFALEIGLRPALALIAQIARDTAETYEFSVVPLFILMGTFVGRAGLSHELYAASNAFLGHRRGGLSMATIVACGGFSAICGSSLATAATMAKVAMPSMRRFGYADSLAAGSIAAGGTLGILIPPSVILIIYGILTETSISALFIAGIVPGIIGVMFYIAAVQASIRLKPELGPAAEYTPWPQRWIALRRVWSVLLLFVIVMGGIYLGVFTPTEAGGVGAFGGFLFALLRGRLPWRTLFGVLVEAALMTSMLFVVLIGALLFANFITTVGMSQALIEFAGGLDVAPIVIILVIVAIYLVLGCVFESVSMILLTVPVFVPLVDSLGFNLVWFGIVVVVVTEISLITPPIGVNVFVLRGLLPDVPTGRIFAGVTPFWIADIFRIALLIFVPALSLVLPSLMLN